MAAIVGVIGAVISAYATYQASQAQAAALSYQQKAQRNQAIAAEQAAQIAAENAHTQHQRVLATQRARLGAAGVISSEGSPLLVQMDSAEQAALDEARILYSGKVQAGGYRSEAILSGYQARTTRATGTLAAGGSLLSGVSRGYAGYKSSSSTDPYADYGGRPRESP